MSHFMIELLKMIGNFNSYNFNYLSFSKIRSFEIESYQFLRRLKHKSLRSLEASIINDTLSI